MFLPVAGASSFPAVSAVFSAIVASLGLVVVVDLCLQSGDSGHERCHLVHHALVLLAGICHVGELLLYLLLGELFGEGVGGDDRFGVALGS